MRLSVSNGLGVVEVGTQLNVTLESFVKGWWKASRSLERYNYIPLVPRYVDHIVLEHVYIFATSLVNRPVLKKKNAESGQQCPPQLPVFE